MRKVSKKEIGERLKEIRNLHGYTTNKFAGMIDITQPSLTKLENGESEPRAKTILALYENFGIDPLWLLTGHTKHSVKSPSALKVAELIDKLPEAVQFLFVMLAERETLLESLLEQKKNAENSASDHSNANGDDG